MSPAGWLRVGTLAGGLAIALTGHAAPHVWPFDTDAERLVEQARLARQRLDFPQANALLDEATGKDPHVEPDVAHERGLLARDRGDLDHALELLKRAADLDPALGARVDQAGVLVQLGRWPEAVVILRQAFDERGTSLPVEQVVSDTRFVKLATLKPYQDVIEAARSEQAGPLGRVLVRLERLQDSARTAEHGAQRLAAWFTLLRDLLGSPLTALGCFMVLALLCTYAVGQMALVRPPWPLAVGVLLACGVWNAASRAVSDGASTGRDTILLGAGLYFAAWTVGTASRWGLQRYRLAKRGAGDPLAAEHLPDTLMLVDEVSRLGHRVVSARRREQRVLLEALRQAGETLRERLDKGA